MLTVALRVELQVRVGDNARREVRGGALVDLVRGHGRRGLPRDSDSPPQVVLGVLRVIILVRERERDLLCTR